jgi:hypothetical protein
MFFIMDTFASNKSRHAIEGMNIGSDKCSLYGLVISRKAFS